MKRFRRKKKVPKPRTEFDFLEFVEPITRPAEDWVLKQLRRFFGVRALRAYFTAIFLGYITSQATINVVSQKISLQVANPDEFIVYSSLYLVMVVVLTLLDFRESKFFAELDQKREMWDNYIKNIQPEIKDADMKLLAMYSFKLEKTPKDFRDMIIKIVNTQIKDISERLGMLELHVNELGELEVLRDLANQIKERKEQARRRQEST